MDFRLRGNDAVGGAIPGRVCTEVCSAQEGHSGNAFTHVIIQDTMQRGTSNWGGVVIITGPSGSGKTTISNALLERHSSYGMTVSMTTRPARPNERDGVDYHFVSTERFQAAIDGDELFEWEEVHTSRYGTLWRELEQARKRHDVVVMDVDPKGGLSIRRSDPSALLVFLKPPSKEELMKRLAGRQTESVEDIAIRMQRLEEEFQLAEQYDHVLVNHHLDETIREAEQLVEDWFRHYDGRAERHKPTGG